MEMTFAWMAWTTPIAIFFTGIVLMLAGMTVWELRSPTVERKGFLPMRTTRGDRLFIGLLTAAYINLAWVAFTEMNQWIAAGLGFLALVVIMAKA
ncbi:DUF2160 domain-containing protein [Duganella sp. FT3S]|jgi:predicted small integral membrane protein|uniref:DUF2160 domain-containing protein n=1 Tax=Rugamonas fusca TaxID=2758568 RepID=A0A7W2EDX6_9BURK|nr:DUF2160 domain-containing protein [Rugamonas fusca]MBA5604164.1 DUF2160 domain-containing protein [Rugamonas fusca]